MRKAIGVVLALGIGMMAQARGWVARPPIYIYGDKAFTWENGVISGAGTEGDPYVIEGWIIDAPGYDYGIYIDSTTAHFVIRNCQVRYPQERAGIVLSGVNNGRIEGTSVFGGRMGIHLLAAKNVVITGNAIGYCDYGIIIGAGSEQNLIFGNSIIACGLPARDEGLRNYWYTEMRGNYWSDYRGQDLNGDGIGDTPYEVVPDRFPLIAPPVKLPSEAAPMRTLDLSRVSERGIVALAPGSLVRLKATDVGVGVDKIFYRLDSGNWQIYQAPFPLPKWTTMVRMEYYAVDKLGNREPAKALTIYLDIQPPVTRIVAGQPHYYAPDGKLWATSRTPFELVSEDDSGVANIFFRIGDRDWQHYSGPFTIPGPEGPHKLDYYAIDLYGNREAVQTAMIWKDDSAPITEAAAEEGRPFEGPAPEKPEVPSLPQTPPAVVPPPAPSPAVFHITLTQATLVENTGVGSNWKLSYVQQEKEVEFQPASLPLLLYTGEAITLAILLRAVEEDAAQNDVGESTLTFTPPWSVGTYGLDVLVYEDNVQTAEKYARWRFTLEIGEEGK